MGCDQCRPGPQSYIPTRPSVTTRLFCPCSPLKTSCSPAANTAWPRSGTQWALAAHAARLHCVLHQGLGRAGRQQVPTHSPDGPVMCDQVACPPGETVINNIALNSAGSVLYSATGNNVRIWDPRSAKAVGKLSGGHQAAVMVLAVDDTDTADGNSCVVTSSKDHYIKVFDVAEDSVGLLTPKYSLKPPHYDGIQSLCLMGDLLFSGSSRSGTCLSRISSSLETQAVIDPSESGILDLQKK